MDTNKFSNRHIGVTTDDDKAVMLEAIGVGVGGAALIEACWQIFGRWKGRLLRRIMRNGD